MRKAFDRGMEVGDTSGRAGEMSAFPRLEMFKTPWNRLGSPKANETGNALALNRDKLKMLTEYFPIGKKLLAPDFDSLGLADKRRKQRVGTAVRADLYPTPDAQALPRVIEIEHLYKSGEFEKIKMMDIVEIKTELLNLRA